MLKFDIWNVGVSQNKSAIQNLSQSQQKNNLKIVLSWHLSDARADLRMKFVMELSQRSGLTSCDDESYNSIVGNAV